MRACAGLREALDGQPAHAATRSLRRRHRAGARRAGRIRVRLNYSHENLVKLSRSTRLAALPLLFVRAVISLAITRFSKAGQRRLWR